MYKAEEKIISDSRVTNYLGLPSDKIGKILSNMFLFLPDKDKHKFIIMFIWVITNGNMHRRNVICPAD